MGIFQEGINILIVFKNMFDFFEFLFRDFNLYKIQEYLKKLDEEFDVVFVNEYMEELIVFL